MRRVETVTIDAEGRDKGKIFVLTELSAMNAERWAGRAIFAMMNAGVEIPEDIAQAGLAGIAALGIQSLTKVSFEAAEPLLDEMMSCVQIQPSPGVARALIEDDIEEVATLLRLRKEVLNLHVNFSTLAAPSTSGAAKTPTRA